MLGYEHQRLLKREGREGEFNKMRIEKIHKIYKSHRDAICFDSGFIDEVMRESIGLQTA